MLGVPRSRLLFSVIGSLDSLIYRYAEFILYSPNTVFPLVDSLVPPSSVHVDLS